MQIHAKQTLQARLKVSVFMNLYGEKPSIRKRKAPKGRFCECGSESKEEPKAPKVPGKRKAPKGRFCECGSESLIIYLKSGGYYE